jgi:formylmethanofuran dehydrogenase subunit E
MAVGTRTAGARRGFHGTEIKTSEVRSCRRDGVDHPLGCDMGNGSAELVIDLPAGAFAFVLEFCVRPKRKAQSLIEAQVR